MVKESEAQLVAAAHPLQTGHGSGLGLIDRVRAQVGQLDRFHIEVISATFS